MRNTEFNFWVFSLDREISCTVFGTFERTVAIDRVERLVGARTIVVILKQRVYLKRAEEVTIVDMIKVAIAVRIDSKIEVMAKNLLGQKSITRIEFLQIMKIMSKPKGCRKRFRQVIVVGRRVRYVVDRHCHSLKGFVAGECTANVVLINNTRQITCIMQTGTAPAMRSIASSNDSMCECLTCAAKNDLARAVSPMEEWRTTNIAVRSSQRSRLSISWVPCLV